jgi:hypothetical protein
MKQVFMMVAAVGALVVGCGPASVEGGAEMATLRQEITPCLSVCYGNCGTNTQCRLDCVDQCSGCDVCADACMGNPYSGACSECQMQTECVWPG